MLYKKIQFHNNEISIFRKRDLYTSAFIYTFVFRDMEVSRNTYEQVLEEGYKLVFVSLRENERLLAKYERDSDLLYAIKNILVKK